MKFLLDMMDVKSSSLSRSINESTYWEARDSVLATLVVAAIY